MKIIEINTVNYGSTGKIALGIRKICKENGVECKLAYRYMENGNHENNSYLISSWLDCHIHNRIAKYTALQGNFSYFHTLAFLKKISKYKPDVIHLHNLHGNYINIPLLFKYIKKQNIKVVWTLHDCWSFTGICPHFDMIGCEQWKYGCKKCPMSLEFLLANNNSIAENYERKKFMFTGINKMTLVTPSKWLAGLVKQSFLKDYPVKVINNGIDLDIFKPTDSDFRKKYALENKYIVLGVAFGWDKRKGLDVFCELAKRLDEVKYQIVLVGTDDNVDKLLPDNIISIHRTQNQTELAEIYTAADLFVNPTREEVLGMVNIESLACGTPVLTFDTGGSPECIDETCGSVVAKDDIDSMEEEIKRVCETKPFSKMACLNKASVFDENDRLKEYIVLYKEINDDKI